MRTPPPDPLPIDAPTVYAAIHPPLPGEEAARPSPLRHGPASPIIVATGTPPPAAAWPEPGSFEPEDAVGVPPPLPDEAPAAWEAELQRRLAVHPKPVVWADNMDKVKLMFWQLRQDSIRATWAVEWREAWQAGQRLPPAAEGT
jgi:hypothetical protein